MISPQAMKTMFHRYNMTFKKSDRQNMKNTMSPLSTLEISKILSAIRLQKSRKKYRNPLLKKEYDISNLPQRDKEKLRPYHDKFQFVNSLPAHLQDLSATHDVYYATFTFRKNYHPAFYPQYFYFFRRKIDQLLNVRSHRHDDATRIIAMPELKPMRHYHSFLLIHKSKSEKFHKSCVDKQIDFETEIAPEIAYDTEPELIRIVPHEVHDVDSIRLKRVVLEADAKQTKENFIAPLMKETQELLQELTEQEQQLKKMMPIKSAADKFSRSLFEHPSLEYMQILTKKNAAKKKIDDIPFYNLSKVASYKISPITDIDSFFHAVSYNSKDFIRDRRLSVDDVIFQPCVD